jgi:hypothetical protein
LEVCGYWVPRILRDAYKEVRKATAIDVFYQYDAGSEDVRSKTVRGDETWVYCFECKSKQQSVA